MVQKHFTFLYYFPCGAFLAKKGKFYKLIFYKKSSFKLDSSSATWTLFLTYIYKGELTLWIQSKQKSFFAV